MISQPLTREDLKRALALPSQTLETGPIDVSRALSAGVAIPVALSPEPICYLILRSTHLADHAGEIAFPGGKRDKDDVNLRATAGRELCEEVGVTEDQMEWLGELSPCPVITGRFLIHPFVALLKDGAIPRVHSGEIEEVLTLPIEKYVRGQEPISAFDVTWRGVRMLAPHFPVAGRVLYGATAYIAYDLLARIAVALGGALAPLVVEHSAPWASRYERV